MFTHAECPSCKNLLPLGGNCTDQRCQSVRGYRHDTQNSHWQHSSTTSHQAGDHYQTPAVEVNPPRRIQVPRQPGNYDPMNAEQNFGYSGTMPQQPWNNNQGQSRNFYQPFSPVHTNNVAQAPIIAPVQAASRSNYSSPVPSQLILLARSASQYYNLGSAQSMATNQNFDYSARAMQPAPIIGHNLSGPVAPIRIDNPAPVTNGYCLMCEADFENIEKHKRDWHHLKGGEPNNFYVIREFESKLMLFYFGTKPKEELRKCKHCEKVLYNHRILTHRCSALGNNLDISPKPNREWVYCLMCKFSFEKICEHIYEYHENSWIYAVKDIFRVCTLLPRNTCVEEELTKCMECSMPIFKGQGDSHQC